MYLYFVLFFDLTNYGHGYSAGVDFETIEDLVFHRQNRSGSQSEKIVTLIRRKHFIGRLGKISLSAMSRGEEVKTEDSFPQLTGSQFGIYITYKGITEEWIEPNNKINGERVLMMLN